MWGCFADDTAYCIYIMRILHSAITFSCESQASGQDLNLSITIPWVSIQYATNLGQDAPITPCLLASAPPCIGGASLSGYQWPLASLLCQLCIDQQDISGDGSNLVLSLHQTSQDLSYSLQVFGFACFHLMRYARQGKQGHHWKPH